MPNTVPRFLEELKARLDEMSEKLFVNKETEVDIPWRDLGTGSGTGTLNRSTLPQFLELNKKNIMNSNELASIMGFQLDHSTMTVTSAEPDLQCRFM